VMHAANAEGFGSYFGSITRGIHDFDSDDRTLVGGNSFEDLRKQQSPYLRQSRRLVNVNRSKRSDYEPPEGGYSSNILN